MFQKIQNISASCYNTMTSILTLKKFFNILATLAVAVSYVLLSQIYATVLASEILIVAYQFAQNYLETKENYVQKAEPNQTRLLKSNVTLGILSIVLHLLSPLHWILPFVYCTALFSYALVLLLATHPEFNEKGVYATFLAQYFPENVIYQMCAMHAGIVIENGIHTIKNIFNILKMKDILDATILALGACSIFSALNIVPVIIHMLILSPLLINIVLLTVLPFIMISPSMLHTLVFSIQSLIHKMFSPSTLADNTLNMQNIIPPATSEDILSILTHDLNILRTHSTSYNPFQQPQHTI